MGNGRSWVLRLARLVYRAILRLAPRRFRETFGAEAETAFGDLVSDELARRGPRAAVAIAAASYGDAARTGVRERVPPWRALLFSGLAVDAKQVLRLFRREPGVASTVTATLGLAVAMTATVFSVLDTVVLEALPYRAPDRLLVIWSDGDFGRGAYGAYADIADYRASVPALASLGGIRSATSFLEGGREPVEVAVGRTTDGLFDTLGAPFAAGGPWPPGAGEAVVLTHGLAVEQFGSAEAAVGAVVRIDGQPMPVTGVLRSRLVLPFEQPDVLVPYLPAERELATRGPQAVMVIGRLRDGVTFEVAATQIATAGDRLTAEHVRRGNARSRAMPLVGEVLGTSARSVPLVFGSALALYLVALASLVSLLAARAASRVHAVAMARALGASTGRLLRAWTLEGVALALPGVLVGLWLAAGTVRLVAARLPLDLPRFDALALDARVVAFVVGLAAATVVLMSLVPLWSGLGRQAGAGGPATRTVVGGRGRRVQAALVGVQVGLCAVLVVGAIWLVANVQRVLAIDPGIRTADVISVEVRLPRHLFPDRGSQVQALDRLRTGLAAHPAVRRVAVSDQRPLHRASGFRFTLDPADGGNPQEFNAILSAVDGAYFETLGLELQAGRLFQPGESALVPMPVVVSESFARDVFGGQALGRSVPLLFAREPGEVVGVVNDVRFGDWEGPGRPQAYTPIPPLMPFPPGWLIVETALDEATLRGVLSGVVSTMRPAPAVVTVDALADALSAQTVSRRYAAAAAVGAAGLAVLLALVNIHALASITVAGRRRELGLRLALGATPASVARLVMRRGVVSAAVGAGAAVVVAVWLVGPAVRTLLYDADRLSAAPALGTALLLGIAATVASAVPARRAAAIDPALTLKEE